MINIAEILKNCPAGTKLYSPAIGECTLNKVLKDNNIIHVNMNSDASDSYFNEYGQLYFGIGECLLFPSKDNRDWSNYQVPHTFKRGDILYLESGDCIVIFDHELDDSAFECKHYYHFCVADYAPKVICFYKDNYKLASKTDIERYKKALKASGKGLLNPKTGELYPIIKPFDKIVARFRPGNTWQADFFSHWINKIDCQGTSGNFYGEVLPFNEETSKLIGTCKGYE